ncbi:MAG TPA: response regulator transcription factor [Bacteroidota bacterium]|nr:response regulator transcription factor [Bacteroidota bacterium]
MEIPISSFGMGKSSVWVVDDNKSYCTVLTEVINKSPRLYCDTFFTSAKGAIRELESSAVHPQVILLDIMMPTMTGLDAIKYLLRASPGVIIIMLTSMDDEDGARLALKRGAKGYILKISTEEDIIRSVEHAVDGGMPLDPMITGSLIQLLTSDSDHVDIYKLSRRELEIIKLIMRGFTSNDVAGQLNISYYTVETHLKHVYTKLDVSNRVAMVAKAAQEGLV